MKAPADSPITKNPLIIHQKLRQGWCEPHTFLIKNIMVNATPQETGPGSGNSSESFRQGHLGHKVSEENRDRREGRW